MPFISVSVSCTLTKAQKDDIKSRLGKLIEILPTKTEKSLMVDISDNHSIYYAGEENEKAAFIDLRIYKESPFDAKSEFFRRMCDMLGEVAGIDNDNIYFNVFELSNWGLKGNFK